jgi:hypothetical protein
VMGGTSRNCGIFVCGVFSGDGIVSTDMGDLAKQVFLLDSSSLRLHFDPKYDNIGGILNYRPESSLHYVVRMVWWADGELGRGKQNF